MGRDDTHANHESHANHEGHEESEARSPAQLLAVVESFGPTMDIQHSDKGVWDGAKLTVIQHGADLSIKVVAKGETELEIEPDGHLSCKFRDIGTGVEVIRYFREEDGKYHKIVLLFFQDPDSTPMFTYYIVHERPVIVSDEPGHGHTHDHSHSHNSVYKLSHQSTHGGGRG